MSVNPAVYSSAGSLLEQFRSTWPFPHFVIDGFLEPGLCQEVFDAFPAFSDERARNEFGETGGKSVYENLPKIAPCYARLDKVFRSREFLRWLSQATGIPELLYDRDYVGGGTHENKDGQELDPHVDFNYHPKQRWHRRLNLILFLNKQWDDSWGGSLQLHLDPWTDASAKTVQPVFNRCIVFETSERSWHGFPKIRLPADCHETTRKSVAVYFYTKERPREEVVPEHGTYYVPQRMPDHLQAGYTLTDADVAELRGLLARRDRQIRYEREHERELRTVFAAMIESPSFRIGRALTWPLRMVRDLLR